MHAAELAREKKEKMDLGQSPWRFLTILTSMAAAYIGAILAVGYCIFVAIRWAVK